jgi:hypothetical protein
VILLAQLFQILWDKGISAHKRIKEIEEGVTTRYETRVLENPYEISKHLKYVIENAPERSVCSSIGGLQQIYHNLAIFPFGYGYIASIKDKKQNLRGLHKGCS